MWPKDGFCLKWPYLAFDMYLCLPYMAFVKNACHQCTASNGSQTCFWTTKKKAAALFVAGCVKQMVWKSHSDIKPIWPSGIIPMDLADVSGPGEFPEKMGVFLHGLQHGLNSLPFALLVVVHQPAGAATPSLVGIGWMVCEV